MTTTYDAPNDDQFISPVKTTAIPTRTYPFRQDLTAIVYVEAYIQRSEFFVPMPLDLPHPVHTNAFLVNESSPSPDEGTLVRFQRAFATVPGDRTEFESASFTFPAFKENSSTSANIREGFSQSVVGKVNYSYVLTADPANDLTISDRFQPLDADDEKCSFVASDSSPSRSTYDSYVTGGVYLQAMETDVARWRGNIWQLRNVFVKAL